MRLIKVQGKGRATAEPDIVTLSFSVEGSAFDYEECLHTLNARVEDLRQSMSSLGLERAQLKTSFFNVRVKTQYRNERHVFAGYEASHQMHIELPVDKELLNRVLSKVAGGHSGAEIRLSFSVKDKDSLRKRVLTQAVQIARENAETLAVAAGVKLGKLVQMDYGWAEVRVYGRDASLACGGPAESNLSADIEPEDVSAEDNVTLVFEIEE